MSVAVTLILGQNDKRPAAGNDRAPETESLPPRRAENGKPLLAHFQHAFAANARGMPMPPPCFMCGTDRAPVIVAPAGPVCADCALVCVEITMDRLAERMAARWGRNPIDEDAAAEHRAQIFPQHARRAAA